MDSEFKSTVSDTLKANAEFLNGISQEIWKRPELKFEEKFAHKLLTTALEDKGFSVIRNYITDTAFRAEFKSETPGPTVVVICEYDALPGVGHACGHNLIAETGLGAGLAIKAAIEKHNVPGKVVVLGTPAEEGGGGKIILLDAGAFKDVDIALMVHPSPDDHLYPPFIAIKRVAVRYIGKEAHASGYPWDGLNALDAAVACYTNVSLLRQHIKPTCKIHGIITKGGDVPNVIPGNSELMFYFRAASTNDLLKLEKRLEACYKSAAEATGCQYSLEYEKDGYDSLITNKILAELYKKYSDEQGVQFEDGNPRIIPFMASSDMGNVSHAVPSIHPTYSIGTKAANHSVGFAEASGAPAAQSTTLIAAQSMALVAIDVMCNPDLLNQAKEQFKKDIEEDKFQD